MINRTLNVALQFKIPEEVWSGTKVEYGHLKRFGCVAYVHTIQNKLSARAIKGIFMGYLQGTKGYMVWLPEEHKSTIRRNSMIYVRAESVCLPVKKNEFDSTCDTSERSVSKSTCVMRLNTADDAATVYSEDISECDIKLVVSEHKPKVLQMGPKSAKKSRSKIAIFEKNVNQNVGRTKFSRINSWLRSQSKNRSYVLDKKRIPAAPFPAKPRRLSRDRSLDQSSTKRFTTEKITGNEIFEKLEDIEELKTPMLKDLFKLQCLYSSETEDQILSKYPNPDDDESLYPPSLGYDGLSQHIDNVWFGVDHSSDWEQDSPASILLSEGKSDLKQLLPETEITDQLLKPKSQRVLAFTEDVDPPLIRPQEIMGERGKSHMFMQKLEALYFRILLGLGFIDVGYGNDFFNGLTK